MKVMRVLLAIVVFTAIGAAQGPEGPDGDLDMSSMPLKQYTDGWGEKHILGFVPNYATVNEPSQTYEPLTVGQKFVIAAHDSFDPYNWLMTGLYAAVYQKQNSYPAFGQGLQGYAKRYAVTFADAADSTMFSEAIFPALLHEDPRYFRLGQGSKWHRIGYALTRVLVTRTDAGGWRWNNSEIEGNLLAAGIGNLYYPHSERGVGETMERFGIGVISDAGFNVLKEFWPDMRHKVLHK
jgi:hypothetical protein